MSCNKAENLVKKKRAPELQMVDYSKGQMLLFRRWEDYLRILLTGQ